MITSALETNLQEDLKAEPDTQRAEWSLEFQLRAEAQLDPE